MEYEYCHTRCKSAFTVFPKENGISSEEISERFLILAESEKSQFFSEESSEKFLLRLCRGASCLRAQQICSGKSI